MTVKEKNKNKKEIRHSIATDELSSKDIKCQTKIVLIFGLLNICLTESQPTARASRPLRTNSTGPENTGIKGVRH